MGRVILLAGPAGTERTVAPHEPATRWALARRAGNCLASGAAPSALHRIAT